MTTRSSNVRFVSSIIAVSEPVMVRPAASKIFGDTSTASLVISRRPRLSASRFAGSMVMQSTLRPRSAAATASAAAVVVLPTPPAPTVMSTRRVARSSESVSAGVAFMRSGLSTK